MAAGSPRNVTLFTLAPTFHPPSQEGLPSQSIADQLFQTTYYYTMARYCILDWAQVREWHKKRESICFSSPLDELDIQAGEYIRDDSLSICYKLYTQGPFSYG